MVTPRLVIFALLLCIGTGCATLGEQQCRVADWYNRGVDDGVMGRTDAQIDRYAKDCGKHEVTVDRRAWNAGWNIGIERFCRPENGYRQGFEGAGYAGACPEEIKQGFLAAYTVGRSIFEQRLRLDQSQQEIARINSQLGASGLTEQQRQVLWQRRAILRDGLRNEQWRLQQIVNRARREGYPVPLF